MWIVHDSTVSENPLSPWLLLVEVYCWMSNNTYNEIKIDVVFSLLWRLPALILHSVCVHVCMCTRVCVPLHFNALMILWMG